MSARATRRATALLCLLLMALLPASANAEPAAPAWMLTLTPMPANFAPGAKAEFLAIATNVGAEETSGESALEIELPTSLAIESFRSTNSDRGAAKDPECEVPSQVLICRTPEAVGPGRRLVAQVGFTVNAATGVVLGQARAGGGAAANLAHTESSVPVDTSSVPFGFLPGFQVSVNGTGGEPTVLAGSHPFQLTTVFGFPTENPGDALTNDGHPRNFFVDLPRGLSGSPAATPVLCTEAELTSVEGCPDESQVGLADITSLLGEVGANVVFTDNVYNMVPPVGSPAELAVDVNEAGIFVHLLAEVRSEGDFGIRASTRDALAFGQQPIFSIQGQIWGTPSDASHDGVRGKCHDGGGSCPVIRTEEPFLTMPAECPKAPSVFEVSADSWEQPSPPAALQRAQYESADLEGAPVSLEDCAAQPFEPSLRARPTTTLTESPSGLDLEIEQKRGGGERESSPLKDLTLTLPEGLTVNPSQAGVLEACSEAQVGYRGQQGAAPSFADDSPGCPDAAKVGNLEVTSPLLVRRNADHEVEADPEGDRILEPLHGSIYIAQPFENPFGSLIATYVVIEDRKTGLVAKLAGEGSLNLQTGQITVRFEENPELPLQAVKAHLFGGSHGAFITPPVCATYTTESDFTPWSAPAGEDVFPTDSFQTTTAPGGGPCPTVEAQLPSAPQLSAGTESPAAGKYSPLLFQLTRADGTQRISRLEATMPTGLAAKLAGVAICTEQGIASARSREVPRMGAAEQADSSCPRASEVGTVVAAVGAGPDPYYATGHAYLAGPYKGAPLSLVTIAPAVAGPFDLGVVVVRVALYLDPATAQVRAISDSLPRFLHGVPLDLRSVAIYADRPGFTLNPTSCKEKSFGGQVISTLEQAAPISERFQVGGCKELPFEPLFAARLFGPTNRGAHPRLRSIFTTKAGEANTARVSFTLPRSEFIDQAHFRTICTRVQFVAQRCPAGSVYGHVKAWSPLLDYPLEGPIYLRSSFHKLPDVVLALHGPVYQPLFIEAAGRVDSVKGGLRVRFQSIPDAPLSRAIVSTRGASKGLFQNSTNVCRGSHRITLLLDAQSGKLHDRTPLLKAQCGRGR